MVPQKNPLALSEHNQEVIASDYSVHIGSDSLSQLERDLCTKDYSRKFILVDEHTIQHCLPTLLTGVPSLQQAEVVEIESGEHNKNIDIAIRLWDVLAELKADRGSVLINLGGGVIGDLGGFVATTYKRGIEFLNVPTTLLAQVDASVGGKVGINHSGFKNQVGAFNNPEAVYVNPQFLNTLSKNQVMSGFAEMLKHGLISDAGHFEELLHFDLSRIDLLEDLIEKSIRIKNKIVLDDPFEKGPRKLLNFGHTIGHALESYAQESQEMTLLHGEAVAIGIYCEAYLSAEFSDMDKMIIDQIGNFVLAHYPAFRFEALAHHRIIEIMRNDKKNDGDKMNFTLLTGPGEAVFDQEVSADKVIDALNFYQLRLNEVTHEA